MGKDIIKIAAFTGSLRKDSYNKAVLRAAGELLPDNAVIDIIDLADIPFLNEDEEAKGLPPAVKDFRGRLFESDALLIQPLYDSLEFYISHEAPAFLSLYFWIEKIPYLLHWKQHRFSFGFHSFLKDLWNTPSV